jgi:transposase
LAHPKNVKAIASAEVKTDKIDARVLGHLLRMDYLPRAFIPSVTVRERRELLRYRCFLVRLRTALKNRLHSLIAKRGMNPTFSDLFGEGGRRWLSQIELPRVYREEVDGIMGLIDRLDMELKLLEKEIREQVEEDHLATLLLTVPGIGYFSALLIVAEIADVDRFPDAKHLCSYAGLVPSVHSSGGKTRYGRITKEGSGWLRWVLIQAVPKAVRKDLHLARYYQDLTKKHGKKIAKVAVARKLLKSIYHMLKRREPL